MPLFLVPLCYIVVNYNLQNTDGIRPLGLDKFVAVSSHSWALQNTIHMNMLAFVYVYHFNKCTGEKNTTALTYLDQNLFLEFSFIY